MKIEEHFSGRHLLQVSAQKDFAATHIAQPVPFQGDKAKLLINGDRDVTEEFVKAGNL